MSWGYWGGYPRYVSAAEKRAKAAKAAARLAKKGVRLQPIALQSKKIAQTFWGRAWCDNLESYSDFENRLPRGRTYVRNGSVLHLEIRRGEVEAKVSGSDLYSIKIKIKPLAPVKWKKLRKDCAGGIGSLLELLSGKLSDHVMGVMTRKESGLFPSPKEIELDCSCPDWADMCKHVAASLYGVGARLDEQPELLFLLRSVDHNDLIGQATETVVTAGAAAGVGPTIDEADLQAVFGVELAADAPPAKKKRAAAPKKGVGKKAKEKGQRPAPRTLSARRQKSKRVPRRGRS